MPRLNSIPGLPPKRPNIFGQMSGVKFSSGSAGGGTQLLTSPRPVSPEMSGVYAGQMGDANGRRITIAGTMTVVPAPWYVVNEITLDVVENALKGWFNSDGWSVNSVKLNGNTSDWFNGITSINVTIDAYVFWNYTAQQAAQAAATELAGYQLQTTFGPYHPFTNVGLVPVFEEPRDAVLPAPPAQTTNPGQNPKVPVVPPGGAAPAGTDFLTQIGSALGFGAAGAAIGAATGGLLVLGAVLIFAMKK